ncbi:uncharacterized protein LOC130805063 isoform X3 [Amaranthus tricolor]|uniref:uncharacterized protein LOC130805063 isoform X3 n=1 Tax=Amaranthus tricolor TaxID=29722 RepID=UPI00258FF262|nr:uncharacterized protein LOC130805063 isoform X3 [Amaranthus tricolor]
MRKCQSRCFRIGQMLEARTFEKGFRGAWFRCKVKKVIRKKGRVAAYNVHYYDYIEEQEETVTLYASPTESSSGQKAKRELMLRPHFPGYFHESDLPDLSTISEVIVAVADVWRVGDLVDWFFSGCFWSGTITDIIDDKRAKERQSGHIHARLIQPLKQAPNLKLLVNEMDEDQESITITPRSSLEFSHSISSHTSVSSLSLLNTSGHSKKLLQYTENISKKGMQDIGGSATGKPSCSDNVSGTYVQDVQAEIAAALSVEQQNHENGPAKKVQLNGTIALNSTRCDSIESTILDMEELVNRVKWLKQILKFGISSSVQVPAWEFLEHPEISTPK